MAELIKRSGFRFGVQAVMILMVFGILIVACGGASNPFAFCSSGYTYCSGSGKCCPNGYPYHCNSGSASGTCYDAVPTKPPCDTYDYCSG